MNDFLMKRYKEEYEEEIGDLIDEMERGKEKMN